MCTGGRPTTGVVWIDVRPRRDLVDRAHQLELRWGPWLATIVEQLPVTGVTFWTAKDADAEGVAATFSVTSSLPVHVLFGARLRSPEMTLSISTTGGTVPTSSCRGRAGNGADPL